MVDQVHQEVVVGAVGAAGQQRVTAIGDAVNLASRIEAANKAAGTSLLISEAAYAEARGQFQVRRLLRVALPGKRGEYDLHEVAGIYDARVSLTAQDLAPKTAGAYSILAAADWS